MKRNNRWILRAFFCALFVLVLFLFIRPDQKNSVGGLEDASEHSAQETVQSSAELKQQEFAESGLQQGTSDSETNLQPQTPVPQENRPSVVKSPVPEAINSELPFSEELFAAFLQDKRVEQDLREQVLWYAYEKELAQWAAKGAEESEKPAEVSRPQTVFLDYGDDYVLFEMEFANREELLNIGDELSVIGAELRFVSKIVPYAIGAIHRDDLYRVAALAEVKRFIPNYRTVISAPNPPYILNELATADAMGYRGSGILVGIMDTGFRASHDYYMPEMIELGRDFGTDADPWADYQGHGTNVAGIFALRIDEYNDGIGWKGMALDARLRIAKVAQGSGESAVVLGSSTQAMAIEWFLDPNDDGSYDDGVDIITSSVGMLGITSTVLSALVEDITQNNRAVFVVAAGNCGDELAPNCGEYRGIMSPANVRNAISVGNILQTTYFLNSSSSYGALTDTSGEYTKPDVVSFGTELISLGASGDTQLVSVTGTSFSAPSVAALIAIILQLTNDLGLDYTHLEIKELLEKTASKPISDYNTDTLRYGHGLVNLQSASEYIMSSQCLMNFTVDPPGLTDSAMWKTTSMADWVSVTASVKLTPGNYTVIYDDIPGYTSPDSVNLRIRNQESENLFPVWSALPTAPLTVSCMPSAAATAQWKISGGEWVNCNSTVQLIPGTYLLEFGSLGGYITPDSSVVGVSPESGAQYFAMWQPAIGWLSPSVGPSAVSSFASLRKTGTETWFPFLGESMLSEGEHCFEFSSVSTYVTPSTTCVDITAQTTTELFIFYEQEMGDLLVNLLPADLSGSAWRIIGNTGWLSSGSRVSTACVTQMVEFQPVSNYDTPLSTSVLPIYQQTVELSGVYVPQNAPLSVWCTPSADAQWKISGGDWQACNSVVALFPGTYSLEFGPLDGYNSPDSSQVSVAPSTGTSFYAVWQPAMGWLNPSASPTEISTLVSLRKTGTETWFPFSGEYPLSTGEHCFEFSSVSTYVTPSTTCVDIMDQTTTNLAVFYERERGDLLVNLFPADLTGTAWRLQNMVDWLSSGSTISASCETQIVEFQPVSFYDTPVTTSVFPLYQQTVELSAFYAQQNADLSVWCTPSADARWKMNGGAWLSCNSTESVTPDTYLLEFEALDGYRTPDSSMVGVLPGTGAEFYALWQPKTGWLNPSVFPQAVSSLAALRHTTMQTWVPFGGEYLFPEGEHCFEFLSVSTYVTPGTTCVDIMDQTTTNLAVFYEREMGDLLVNLFPADLTGTAWRLQNTVDWLSSGSTVSVSCETQIVEFQPVSFYDTPAITSVLPLYQQTVELSALYVLQNADLSVWCTPSADAQWKINGQEGWRSCNSTISVTPDTYLLDFSELSGYYTPDSSAVAVLPGTGGEFSAVWLPKTGWLRPSVAPVDISTLVSLRQISTSTWLDFSGEYLLNEGDHCFEFSSLSSYVTPSTTCVAITDQTTTDLLVFYERETGGLRVNLFPADLTESAWRFVATTEWLSSGSTVHITCETRMLEFKPVSFYDTPAGTSVLPLYQQTVELSAFYVPQPVSLSVFCTFPADNIAQWRINGTDSWQACDSTTLISPATYLLEFSSINGYRTPASSLISVPPVTGSSVYVSWEQMRGFVRPTLEPELISEQVSLRPTSTTTWLSFMTDYEFAAGEICFEFSSLSSYETPTTTCVSVSDQTTVDLFVFYEREKGNIIFELFPTDLNGSAWRPVGFQDWLSSGSSLSLTCDTWPVEFRNVSGYDTPANTSVLPLYQQTVFLSAEYLPRPAELTVFLAPAAAAESGAWRIYGQLPFYESAEAIGLNAGNYLLDFLPVPGYRVPEPLPVSLSLDQQLSVTAVYQTGSVDYNGNYTTFPLSGGLRCSAESFAHVPGLIPTTETPDYRGYIADLQMSAQDGANVISFRGVAAEDDNLSDLTNGYFFPLVYRCAENSDQEPVWERIGLWDESGLSVQNGQVYYQAVADISGSESRQLRDPSAIYQDEYWYLVLGVFSNYSGDLKSAYEQAVANFERNDEGADRRPQNWSNFLLTRFYPSFDFSAQNRSDEDLVLSGSLVEPDNFLPIWTQSTDGGRPDFTHYSFALSGARAVDGSLLSTAAMIIRSFTRIHDGVTDSLLSDPGFNADGGRAVSAHGLKLATAFNGLSALLSVTETSALLTNDIFMVELEAGSQLSSPQTTALTMIFIVQEAARPLLISSSLLQQGSEGWQAFDWQMNVPLASGGGLPWPAQAPARYVAEFSEPVSSAVLRLDVVEGEQGGDGLPMFALQSQDLQGVDTSFYADISTERFGELLGDGNYMDIIPLVYGATDNQNVVPENRNVMQTDGQGRFHIVTTPYVTEVLTGSPESPLSRNGTISLRFSSPVTTPLWRLRQGLQVNGLADFSLRKAEDNRQLLLEPLAGAEMALPGTDTGSIMLHRGYALNSSSFPMITTWNGTVYFSPDLTPPLLTAYSLQGNPSMTAVSGYLQFNEPLLSNAEYPRLYLSGATMQELTKDLDFVVSGSEIRFALSDLDMEQEFFLRAVLSDVAGNVSSYNLPSFITLNPDSDTMISDRALVEQINALENPPYMVGISPDFQQQSNRANVSLRPLFFVEFSRNMQDSVTEAVILTTEGTVVPVRLDFFREYKMQFMPESDLLPDTDYMLSFAVDKAVDEGGRALSPAPVFSFRTEAEPSALVETVTEFLQYTGNNLSSLMETGLVPRFYFDRPVDVRSLASAVEFRDADGVIVSGFWNIEGGDALFSGADFVPGGSYSCTVYTSRITDLSGLRIQGNIPQPPVLFTVLSELEIRNFRVLVEPVAETLYVTASWLPSLDKTDISTYYFGYYELIALSEPEPGVEPVWLAELPHSDSRASFNSSTQIAPFVQGNSYRFVLSAAGASGAETRAFVDVLSVSPVEILSRAPLFLEQQLQMGDVQENGAELSLKPQQTLRESETFSVSVVENENLKKMRGGGERYAKMMQLGPAGLKFVQPVVLGLKFSAPSYQTFADLSPQCVQLDMACEQALFEILHPLVLDFSRQQWTAKGLGKKRVEIINETNAIMYAIVPHFSIYTVAASLSIVSPSDNALLSAIRTDSTVYSALINLNRGAAAQDVSVSFLPADSNLSYRLVPDGSSIEIYLNGAVFQPPADYSSEIAVTVAVTDVGSSQTDSRSYRIPIDYMDGNRDYAGYPRNVDIFSIRQPDANTVEAEWNIDSDIDRQIHKFILSYRQLWPQNGSVIVQQLERVNRSFSFPVNAGEQWELTMATESYLGIRSRAVNNQVRRTWGHAEIPVTASGPVIPGGDWLMNGRRVDNFRFTLKNGEEARFFKYTAEDINTLQSSGLLFSAADKLSNGVSFFPETLFDINFSATTEAELEYTVNRTGDQYAVYHFGGSSWRRLTGTGSLQAEIQENGQSSLVRIKSFDGAGSPFVLGVESVAVPVWTADVLDGGPGGGGSGGCSVGTIDDGADWRTGFLNLLLMLCPLGWLILRYLYRN